MNKLIYKGNLNDFKTFAGVGVTKGNWNERALKYFQYLGATSNSFNTAQKEIEEADLETLRLDFVNQDYAVGSADTGAVETKDTFDNILTFSRGSTGTYFDSAGVLQTAAVDEPRFTYDPDTLEAQGLLIEEQRTNILLNSDAPATQTVTVSDATVYTLSVYGTGSAAITVGGSGTATEGGDLTFTTSGTSVEVTVTGSLDYFQLELGSFSTSIIVTGGSQVTRSADNCTRTLGSEFNASEGTLFVEFSYQGSSNVLTILETRDSNNLNGAIIFIDSSQRVSGLVRGSSGNIANTATSAAPGVTHKAAISWGGGTFVVAGLGVSASNTYEGDITPAAPLRFYQSPQGDNSLGGVVKITKFIPRALSSTELQELTA